MPDQKTTELKRGDHGWQMLAPLAMPADPNLVRTLLDTLDITSEKNFPASDANLAKYGLDKPAAELWLNDVRYASADCSRWTSSSTCSRTARSISSTPCSITASPTCRTGG